MDSQVIGFIACIIGLPLTILGGAFFVGPKFKRPESLFFVVIAIWFCCVLGVYFGLPSQLNPLLAGVVVYSAVFLLPLTFFSLLAVKFKPKSLILRILKWVLYTPIALFFSFWFVFLQPGQGLDYDGAMESSDACYRAYVTVLGKEERSDSIYNMENPKQAGFELGYATHYWTRGDNYVVCRANHYLRRVTKFEVDGVSKLHLIEREDRAFKHF